MARANGAGDECGARWPRHKRRGTSGSGTPRQLTTRLGSPGIDGAVYGDPFEVQLIALNGRPSVYQSYR